MLRFENRSRFTLLARNILWGTALWGAALGSSGCGEATSAARSDDVAAARPEWPAAGPQGAPGPGAPEAAGGSSKIREIMQAVGRGPDSLAKSIGNALSANPPSWDAVEPQAQEFARLATALGAETPRRGSKESWETHALAFAKSAQALDQAVRSKDRDAALAAHSELSNSCNACHRDHRRMRRGMGM